MNEDYKIRYYVCGIGYDENNCVTDDEWNFGDFDTYEEAYEFFVKLYHKDDAFFFENRKITVPQMALQLEECKETEDNIECIDVKNATWFNNPNFYNKGGNKQMKQLTLGTILELVNLLKKEGMTEKEIMNLPIYIGNDEELNGIHTAWYAQSIDSEKENDMNFIELIKDDSSNVELKGKAILIS